MTKNWLRSDEVEILQKMTKNCGLYSTRFFVIFGQKIWMDGWMDATRTILLPQLSAELKINTPAPQSGQNVLNSSTRVYESLLYSTSYPKMHPSDTSNIQFECRWIFHESFSLIM
jgi:hypothetical protein